MNKSLLFKSRQVLWYSFLMWMYLFCLACVARATAEKTGDPSFVGMTQENQQSFDPSTGSGQAIQGRLITGTVRDARGVLPGVTVALRQAQGDKFISSNNSVITDAKGQFSIATAIGDVLVFTYVGYKEVAVAVTVAVGSAVNVTMEEDATTLKEVTVNAGYYKVKEKERTGSIAKITAKDIESQPVTNVLATMQGRMAGVNVTQTTGTPGGGFDLQIRGQNSLRLNGNNPLYVIDGVPYNADPIGTGINSAVLPTQPSPLNSINPDQIASIEVLKDADATAIYGSRGANGVVLITTKQGQTGKTRFSAKVSQGAGRVTRFMDLMNTEQYLAMRTEAYANDGIPIPSYAYDVNGTWDTTRNTDWQKKLMGGTAAFSEAQVSVGGGSATTQYLLSGQYNQQTSVLPKDYTYKKANVFLTVNHKADNGKFESQTRVGYTLQDNNQPRVDLMREAVTIAPNAPALYNEDGTLNWENNTFNNPLRNLEGSYGVVTKDLIANVQLSYQLLPDLKLQTSLGYTALTNRELTANPSTRYNPAYGLGPQFSTLIASGAERSSWIAEPQLNWKWTFGKGTLDALTGATFQSQRSRQRVQYAAGFSSNSLIYNLAAASNIYTLNDDVTDYRYMAFYGRLNYNHAGKYIVNLTGRRDGSSRFGPGKQFATFGAVGVAWLFSHEDFLKDNTLLSFGKLRLSYGVTGSDQIGDYQYLNTYATSGVSYGSTVGLQPTHLFNPAFGWETNKKLEVALETGFWKDRIFMTLGWYRNRSTDQLTGVPLPGTTGFPSILANLDATVQNQGVEFTLRTVNVQGKDFTWSTQFNLSANKNKLLAFPDLAGSTYANQYVIGQSLSIQKLYRYTGVDPQTGVYTYADANGDGVLTTDDRTSIADFTPKYYGGLQNSLTYKNWQLDFLFQFVKQDNYNSSVYFGLPGSQGNQPTSAINHWQQPGDVAATQLYTDWGNGAAIDAYYTFFESTGAVSDASYVRLKNVSLSYKLPLKDYQCRLFFEGQNVLTFTRFNGADPEFKSVGYLPPLRMLTFGVQFGF